MTTTTILTTPTIRERIKHWIIDKATGAILPRLMLALLAGAASMTMQFYGKAASAIPGLAEIVDPTLLVDLVSQAIVAVALLAIARWTGKPVREWQRKLADAGCYFGRIDGAAGPQTEAAFTRAINRPYIEVNAGQLVNTKLD